MLNFTHEHTVKTLHPIMFLLNHSRISVSERKFSSLHPIMFLLNHSPKLGFSASYFNFTSHYVPIKSSFPASNLYGYAYFTSHYVPIKSEEWWQRKSRLQTFTSHYVPIKSYKWIRLGDCKTLYIPLCSY